MRSRISGKRTTRIGTTKLKERMLSTDSKLVEYRVVRMGSKTRYSKLTRKSWKYRKRSTESLICTNDVINSVFICI